jgi:hypothetical protein
MAVEVLVVDYQPGDISSSPPVVALAPPRVAVLRVDEEDVEAIGSVSRLAMARRPAGEIAIVGDESALAELDAGARLFVEGWRSKVIDKPDRLGEGLSWDHPGFQPPDRPGD